MENASKALIMGGAVLIAILIISVGIVIFSSTDRVTDHSKEIGDLAAVEAYNNQFSKYCGDNVIGSEVINLINFVGTYSARNGSAPTLTGTTTEIKTAKRYKVSITKRETNGEDAGKITEINIQSAE